MNRNLLILAGALLVLIVLPALMWNGLIQQGNASAYDMLLRLTPARQSPAPDQLVLLAIDDETVGRYGGLPLNRAVVAEALKRVGSGGPKVVAVDMLLSERTNAAADASLADVLSHFPKVVLATALEAKQDSTQAQWIRPLPEFRQHAFALGHVHIEPDRDGVARTLLLTKANAEKRYWALGFEAFRASLNAPGLPIEYSSGIMVEKRRVPATASNARLLWIHYDGPEGAFRRVSLASVLNGRTPASAFSGKIVILGVTAQGAGDRFYTPYSAGLGMSGIEIHANIIATLLDGAYLTAMAPVLEFLWLLGIVALVAIAAWWRNGRLMPLAAIIGVVAIPVFSYWMLRAGIIVPVASALAVHLTASVASALANTLVIRGRLGEALESRQDYAFRLQAVAHEIKTPLTAIHASSQLITEPEIPEEKKEEIAERIHKEAGRLSGVVTTFLDVERIAAGVLKLRRHDVELVTLIAEAIERANLLAVKKQIRIESDLQAITVSADAELLQYAVYNLLTNAIKYSPDESVIRISLRPDQQAACLVVADQGCGIEPSEQQHIFERFYRTRRHREDAASGAGIGLALVKEIVTQHGGTIEVDSEPGKGSSFSVFLPREASR